MSSVQKSKLVGSSRQWRGTSACFNLKCRSVGLVCACLSRPLSQFGLTSRSSLARIGLVLAATLSNRPPPSTSEFAGVFDFRNPAHDDQARLPPYSSPAFTCAMLYDAQVTLWPIHPTRPRHPEIVQPSNSLRHSWKAHSGLWNFTSNECDVNGLNSSAFPVILIHGKILNMARTIWNRLS